MPNYTGTKTRLFDLVAVIRGHSGFMLICSVSFIFVCLGCDEPIIKQALPAPLRAEVKTTLKGRIYRFWGGDNFEFGQSTELHYILLRGACAPAPGEPLYHQSKAASIRLTRDTIVEVRVVDRDEAMREIADVIIPVKSSTSGEDVSNPPTISLGIELLNRGLAFFHPEDFPPGDEDLAAQYMAAQQHAQQAGIGVWKPEQDD